MAATTPTHGRYPVTDPTPPEDPADPIADTARFEAFAEGTVDEPPPARAGVPFRVVTLLAGLAVLGGLLWLLFLL